MAARCKVTVRDSAGALHTVELAANSKFEAVGLALAELRSGPIGKIGPRYNAEMLVEVVPPTVIHHVSPAEFSTWLNAVGQSPKEQAMKADIRAKLA